ncbi:MAG: AI-2E family transporter [bacterium]|nr:AI-2E family transporter [bacterium]
MQLSKENMKKIMAIIAFGIGFYWLLNNLNDVSIFTGYFINLLFPFILGGILAFILNIPMTKIENFMKRKQKMKNSKFPVRTISIVLALFLFLVLLLLISFLLIPELVDNIRLLLTNIPKFVEDVQDWILDLANSYPDVQKQIENAFRKEMNFNDLTVNVLNYVISSSLNFVASLITSIFTLFTAIVFAVYMLSQKEYLILGVKKLLYAYLKKEYVEKILEIAQLSNKTFSKFISGQCVEACILGIIFFVAMTLFQFPYALIISVLVTCTALIPLFGAMIAMVIGAILIAVTSPWKALLFIVVFQVIQQIENNFIYPKVVGKSVGLSSIWTLLAVLLGGSLMGVVGMIIGLPMASILYAILRNETNDRIKLKKIKI